MKEIKTKIFKDFLSILKPEDNVIEMGSHQGWLTNQIYPNVNKLITYEAEKKNYDILIKNIFINVDTHNLGVVSEEAQTNVPLYFANGKVYKNEVEISQYHSLYKRKFWNGEHTTMNTINFLDTINSDYDILVMDIEGAEREILLKYHNEIIKQYKTICFEYHPDLSKHVNTLLNIYDLYVNQYSYCYPTGHVLYLKSRRHVRLWNNSITLLFTEREIKGKKVFDIRERMEKFAQKDPFVRKLNPDL